MYHEKGALVKEKTSVTGSSNWGLVVVDMQNDFLAAAGYYSQRKNLDERVDRGRLTLERRNRLLSQPCPAPPGRFRYRVKSLRAIVTNICRVIEYAKKQRRPIVYLQAGYGREFDAQPPFLRQEPDRQHYPGKPGSWGAALIEPITRLIAAGHSTVNEMVIEKHTFDGFFQTRLRQFLRERQVETVVIVGVETHVCVMATAQSASINQFKTIILEDCIWTAREDLGQGALAIFRDAFGSTARAEKLFNYRASLNNPKDRTRMK
ncbi:MAG: isochorismatase family cysteine hydrolase [Candidatus Binatia bacterium]